MYALRHVVTCLIYFATSLARWPHSLFKIMPHPAQSSSDDIVMEIPGYKFWIEVDGKRTKQYQIEHDNDVVSCYIASEVDKVS